jgi:hypothetical protein
MDQVVEFLRAELTRRSERNPQYSLRAFSRALGVQPSTLSRVLSRQLDPSVHMCAAILSRLSGETEGRSFLEAQGEAHKQRMMARVEELAAANA